VSYSVATIWRYTITIIIIIIIILCSSRELNPRSFVLYACTCARAQSRITSYYLRRTDNCTPEQQYGVVLVTSCEKKNKNRLHPTVRFLIGSMRAPYLEATTNGNVDARFIRTCRTDKWRIYSTGRDRRLYGIEKESFVARSIRRV